MIILSIFVLYPYRYNRDYKISRVFVPVFATINDLAKRTLGNKLGASYDGILIMLMGNSDITPESVLDLSRNHQQAVIWVNNDCSLLISAVKKYIAAKYLESQKANIMKKIQLLEKSFSTTKGNLCNDFCYY